jgi:hypothetical protein
MSLAGVGSLKLVFTMALGATAVPSNFSCVWHYRVAMARKNPQIARFFALPWGAFREH